MKSFFKILFAPLLASILWPLCALAGPIDTLQPGEWYMAPNSNLSALDPCPARDCTYSGVEGHTAVMDSWSGGAYDSVRDRLVVWGGGHNAYGGNELYTFDIATLTWSRATPPSNLVTGDRAPPNTTTYYANGLPSARHTYGYLQYAPNVDRFFSMAAVSTFGEDGTSGRAVDAFNFATGVWERKANGPSSSPNGMTAYDPIRGAIWFKGNGYFPSYSAATTLSEYNPQNNTWTQRDGGNSDLAWDHLTAAVDTTRRQLVAVGSGKVIAWDISSPTSVTRRNITTTGATSIQNANDVGFAYDPVSDRFVAWNGGAVVYTLNPATWVWTAINPAATNTVTPTSAEPRGTYGRFRYIPSKNAFIVVNRTTENVFFYKLSAGAATPLPTVTLTATPATVVSGGSSTLTWSSTNATSCAASGAWSGRRSTANAVVLNSVATRTYTITCTGVGGSASQSATITVT